MLTVLSVLIGPLSLSYMWLLVLLFFSVFQSSFKIDLILKSEKLIPAKTDQSSSTVQ